MVKVQRGLDHHHLQSGVDSEDWLWDLRLGAFPLLRASNNKDTSVGPVPVH